MTFETIFLGGENGLYTVNEYMNSFSEKISLLSVILWFLTAANSFLSSSQNKNVIKLKKTPKNAVLNFGSVMIFIYKICNT